MDVPAIETKILKKGHPLKSLLKISLDLFDARQTGILYGTNHTKLKFLPTILWDRGIMDRFDGKGLKGLILKLFGPWMVTKRKLSPVFFYKTDRKGDLKENDGIIAYILRNYEDYYTKGIRIIVCPDTGEHARESHREYLCLPFFVYNGNCLMPAEDEVGFDIRIIRHFNSENSIYIYLPDYGILVINTADKALLKIQGKHFVNEEELIKRLNVLMRLVETLSLTYLGQVKGKKGAELLWRKEEHLRQTSRDLIENEKKYRDLYENAPIAYFSIDPKGNILHCNRKAEILSGYAGNELFCKNVTSLFLSLPGMDEKLTDIRKYLAQGRPVRDMEFLMMPNGGDAFSVSISVEAVTDNSGRILEFRAMVLDISQRKSLEKQLLMTQKMEAVGTLAGGIAHDFNNILSPISGYTEMLLMETGPDDPAKEPFEIILDCVNHAKELVNLILTFSRQKVHEQKRIRLEDVVKDSMALVRSFLPATIKLNVTLDEGLGIILADPAQIHQIIMNLAANAYHSMKDNGGILEVSLHPGRNNPSWDLKKFSLTRDYLCLSISDTGIGIDPDLLDKIFDPYFSTKHEGKFSGIGLYVVHGIVEHHGGYIHVETAGGNGTRFDIYFPVIEKTCAFKQAPPQNKGIQKGTERVLLVDDDKKVALMETHMMEKLGYTVTGFSSSMEALHIFTNNPDLFDVIVTDMTMPELTGIQFAKKIYDIRPDIPVIICTGLGDTMDQNKLDAPAVKGLLKKPVSVGDLSFTLKQVLDESALVLDAPDYIGQEFIERV